MNKVIVDKARLLRRVIIISWISLALCFVIKIFGGNFFEIMCDNPKYKALCNYADTHLWLDFLIAVSSSFLCETLYLLAILQRYKFSKTQFIITATSVALSTVVKIFFAEFGFIGDVLLLFGLPFLFLGKNYKRYPQVFIAFALTFAFQLVSLVVKGLADIKIDETYFTSLIYMVDVYIMCALYYLYRNYKKENNAMGKLWVLFAGKSEQRLKAMKARREKQIAKKQAENNAIDLELAKRKNEK